MTGREGDRRFSGGTVSGGRPFLSALTLKHKKFRTGADTPNAEDSSTQPVYHRKEGLQMTNEQKTTPEPTKEESERIFEEEKRYYIEEAAHNGAWD